MKTRILLIEDDETASELIYEYLKDCGFEVTPVFTASDGASYLQNEEFDLILLDINLPDFNGFEVLKSLHGRANLPVIVTSAYNDTKTKLDAFRLGASDYMVKPVDMEELEARIWVQIRKNGPLNLQKSKRRFQIEGAGCLVDGKRIDLTAIESEIFGYLIQRKNQVVSREELCRHAHLSTNRSLDNHIKNIRKKLFTHAGIDDALKTVYGVGYMLKDE